jgi:hypothetical protein
MSKSQATDPDDFSIPEIKDAILCKLVSMAIEFAVDDRDKDDLANLVNAWANANDRR